MTDQVKRQLTSSYRHCATPKSDILGAARCHQSCPALARAGGVHFLHERAKRPVHQRGSSYILRLADTFTPLDVCRVLRGCDEV